MNLILRERTRDGSKMRVSGCTVMRLSLMFGLLLAMKSSASSASAASNTMKSEASNSMQATTQEGNQQATNKSQLASETMDLKRLSALDEQQQQQQQLQLEPVATANHQTRVSYHKVPLNMADLMMASHSMPAGRRRLDSEEDVSLVTSNRALLDSPASEAPFLSGETLIAAPALNRQANQRRPAGLMDQYGSIVDNGAAGSGPSERFPSAQLLARLSNDQYNRMALASAQRQQQALVSKMARRQLQGQRARGASDHQQQQQQQRKQQARRRAGGAKQQMARQESQTRRAKSAGRARGGARARQPDDESEELDEEERGESSNRDQDSASNNADELDDEDGGDERSPALNRRSSDPFFDEAEQEERRDDTPANYDKAASSANFNNNNDDDEAENEDQNQMRRRQGGPQADGRSAPEVGQRARGKSFVGNRGASDGGQGGRLMSGNGGQKRRAAGRQSGGQEESERESEEDIDSMNSSQELVRASLRNGGANANSDVARRPLVFDDANSINGHKRRAAPGQEQADDSMNTAAQFNGARNLESGHDTDLSASHIRNSATDLQAAAGHHHGHGHYYQHVEVPKKKAWKFGFKRGNHKHTIEKHEKGYKHKFHTKFKWHAKEKCKKKSKCESVGKMTWDYKHHKKHHH